MHLRPREHVVHFTPRTLRAVITRTGLTLMSLRTPNYLFPPCDLQETLGVLRLQGLRKPAARLGQSEIRDGLERLVPGPTLWPIFELADRLLDATHLGYVVFATARVP
jgi:hypothetical protein